jgi:hypothetical protein
MQEKGGEKIGGEKRSGEFFTILFIIFLKNRNWW